MPQSNPKPSTEFDDEVMDATINPSIVDKSRPSVDGRGISIRETDEKEKQNSGIEIERQYKGGKAGRP